MAEVSFEPSPDLVELGLAIGVLTGTTENPAFDNGFFEDPGGRLGGILANPVQRVAALNLLSRVLDGTPGPGTVEGEQWVPLVTTDTTPRLGLWGVVTEVDDDAIDIGIALLVRSDDTIGLELSVVVPLVRLGSNGVAEFLAGEEAGVIRIEASIELGDAVALGDLSITAITVQLGIPTDGSDPTVELRVAVPPEGDTNDLVINPESDLGAQLLELLLRFGAAASGDAADELAAILDLLGLGTDPAIPGLPIADIFTDPVDALWGWVRSLATPATITAWVSHLVDLVGADPIAGSGTPTDPARLCVTAGVAELCLTFAVDTSGPAPVLIPGIAISAAAPGSLATGGSAALTATLARITLAASPTAELVPSLDAAVQLGDPTTAGVLIDEAMPGVGQVRIDAIRAGLRVGSSGVEPLLEAHGVDIGTAGSFPVLDLTDTDALLDVAGAALDSVITSVLAALGADDAAEALLVLTGIRRPAGETTATWPEEVALPALFSDPVNAVASYHRAVLAAGRWPLLGAHIVRLLGTNAALDAATGAGTDLDPWRIELADTAVGAAHLLTWTTTDADGIRLHLGVELVPTSIDLTSTPGGPTVGLHARAAFVSIRLADATGSAAPPDPVALGSVGATLVLDGELQLDAGFVRIDADRITGGVVWDRLRGLQPVFDVTNAELALDPEPLPIPIPRLDPDTGSWVWDDDIPWAVIERLIAAALVSANVPIITDVARLLGWLDTSDDRRPAVPPLSGMPAEAVAASHLALEDLIADPLGALSQWAAALLVGPQGQEWAEQLLGWLARAAAGAAAGVSGSGAASDPWGASLGVGNRTRLALSRGAASAPLGRAVPRIPLAIADAADGTPGMGAPPLLLDTTLERAATVLPRIRDLLDRDTDITASLGALAAAVTDTDGLASAASQGALAGATIVTELGVGLATSAFQFRPDRHLIGGPDETGRIHVRVEGAGVLDWADVDPTKTVDLTDRTLTAPAFDLTGVTGDGPWFVVLPSRAATGIAVAVDAHAELVARLTRVVQQIVASRPGLDLAVIAHGPAGHVAKTVAGTVAGVTHLTTIGTAHAGAVIDVTAGAAAEGFRILQSLRGLVVDEIGDLPFADELLRSLAATIDTPAPLANGAPPPPAFPVADANPVGVVPAVPASVTATAVVTTFPAEDVERAFAEVTRLAIRDGIAAVETATSVEDDQGGTSVGYRADAVSPAATPGVRVGVTVGPDLFTITRVDPGTGIGPLPIAGPRLVVGVHVDRSNGWLLGSATSALRARSLDVELRLGLGASGVVPGCTITIHDAGVLGVSRTRWVIDLTDTSRVTHLTPDERVLVGATLETLGPLPATGPVRAAVDLLAAFGVLSIAADGSITVDLATIETALTSTADVLIAATNGVRIDAIAAVTALLGGTTVDLGDGFELVVDLAPRSAAALTLRTTGAGVDLPLGLRLAGELRLDTAGRITASIELSSAGASANQRVSVIAAIDTAAATVASVDLRLLDTAGAATRTVALLPTPNVDGLVALATEVAPAALLQLALGALRTQVPDSAAFLTALGFGPVDEPIRLPATLLSDPVAWFLDSSALGLAGGRPDPAAVVALVDAVRTFTGAGGPSGTVELPWGLTLGVDDVGGDLTTTLQWPAPVTTGPIRLGGTLGLSLTAAGELVPSLATDLDIVGGGGAVLGVSLGVATTGVTAAGRVGGATIPLLPNCPGLGALAAGATKVLPLVLDAAASAPAPVGPAVEALGLALGLHDGTRFVEAELVALAGDPGQQLLNRLRTNIAAGLAALEQFVDPIFPDAGIVDVVGSELHITPIAEVSVTIDLAPLALPTAAPPRVCVIFTGVEPVAGLAIGAAACISDGPDELMLSVAVTDPALLLGLLPELTFAIGSTTASPGGRIDLALWTDVPTEPTRNALVGIADLGAGSMVVQCRHHDITDHDDLGPCGANLITNVVLPRLLDLVLSVEDVRDALETQIGTGPRIGDLLHDNVLVRSEASGIARYVVKPGAFRLSELPGRALRTLTSGLSTLLGDIPVPGLEPLTVGIATDPTSGRIGVRLGIERTKDLELFAGDGFRLAIESDARWIARARGEDPDTLEGGVELYLLTMPAGANAVPQLDPRIVINGIGLRAAHDDPTQKLLDVGVSVRSVGVHGWYERSFTGTANEAGGAHIELDQFGLPVGEAGGNPVASSFMSSDESGDSEDAAPAFSPALSIYSTGSGLEVDLRAGEGDGPWWIPIQQAFGPIYIDQLGIGVGRDDEGIDSLSVLLDGGASMAGLTIALDDLEVIVPWDTPLDLSTWRLDLAGFAIGYSGSGLTVAGGLKKFNRAGHPDYVGMVQVQFPPYGATGVGAYGVFPDGSGGEYTSFFAFVAVNAPIGGPPVFFVTGLGGGFGLNRELIAPDITEVETFPLVTAFTGGLADNPMAALETLGETFPPKRGALWFAAGLSFTTFALVNTTAVITVAIDGGVELNLFGLSKMQLPPAPAPPMASVELALHARFSSAEAVLSVQAQLTDNSWIINRSVRLTGGFAFIIWFRTGQFVFTIGGYGPAFDKPSHYPDVPRVGLCWTPTDEIVIKGGLYFCLTSSCVMAGGDIELAYRSGSIWASLESGLHILVSWDPFFYDFQFYVSISAGVRWKTFLGTISFSFHFGVDIHIEGPELRGSATLDLDVVSVTVRFGPRSTPNSSARISFETFLSDYVLEPPNDSARHALAASVTEGQLLPPVDNAGGEANPDDADDGTAAKPWRVIPEFTLAVQTRAATNSAPDLDTPLLAEATGQLDTGPTGDSTVVSTLRAQIVDGEGNDKGDKVTVTAEYGFVPEAAWRVLPVEPSVAEEKTIFTCLGVSVKVDVTITPGRRTIDIDGVEVGRVVHPLPLNQERAAAGAGLLKKLRAQGRKFDKAILADNRAATDVISDLITTSLQKGYAINGVTLADTRLDATRLLEDRAAPPQIVSLAHGIAETKRPTVKRTDRQIIDIPPIPTGSVAAPRLESVIRATATTAGTASGRTVGGGLPATSVNPRLQAPRLAPPSIAEVRAGLGARLGADLRVEGARATLKRGTLTLDQSLPATTVAGAGRQRLLVGATELTGNALSAKASKAFASSGTKVRPGDTQVWVRDNSAFDTATKRPTLQVDGAARVTIIDRGGVALIDRVISSDSVEVPNGAARIAVTGGTPTGGASGWTSTDALTEVADGTWLASGATVRSAGSTGGSRASRSGVVRARSAIRRSGRIETDLPSTTRTVVVALDGGDDDAPELAIGGAEKDGETLVVRHGGRVLLVTAVQATADVVTVGVAPNDDTALGGVIGSPLSAATVARTLATDGLGAVAPNTQYRGEVATVTWRDVR